MRNTIVAKLLVGGLLGLSGVGAMGCNGSSDGKGTLLATGTATVGTSLGTLAPGVSIPGLPADPSALEGPRVDIASPADGTVQTDRRVTVSGVVTDSGQGVAEVHVAGRTVQLDASGAFRETVDLPAGLNTILVEAWDNAQRRRERQVSVLVGDTADENAELPNVASARVTETALDLIEPKIAAGVEAEKAKIVAQALSTKVNDETKITGFRFGKVGAQVDAAPGGVRFQITIDDVQMDLEYKAKFLLVFSSTKRGTVRAQQMRLEGVTNVAVVNGVATTQVVGVTATAINLTVPDWASGETNTIRRSLEAAFSTAGAQGLQQGLSQAFATTKGTIAQKVQGKDLSVDWSLGTLTCDEAGITATYGANIRPAQATSGKAMGSFVSKVGLANLTGGAATGPNVAVAMTEDLLNRSLHAAWRGGALDFILDAATAAATLPPGSPALDTSSLLAVAPELAAVGLLPGLPLELEVESALPAVVRLRGQQGPHLLSMGALKVTMTVVAPTGRLVLAESVYAVDAEFALVEQGGKLSIAPAGKMDIHADALTNQPGAELILERLAATVGPQLISSALAQQAGVALPTVQGISVTGLTLGGVDGNLVLLGTAK